MERFAIVGFGCAGCHALKALRAAGCSAAVDVYSDTGLPPYNPMLTTYYVKGKIPYEAMFPFGSMEQLKQELSFTLFDQCTAASIDAGARTLRRTDGTVQTYDKILVSTGARAFVPPVGTLPDERIFSMRSVEDAVRLKEALAAGTLRRVLVVGASMVGIKIVELLEERGIEVVLSDLAPHIFPTAAFAETSRRIEGELRERGIVLRFGEKTTGACEQDGRAEVSFSGGDREIVDAVVVCIGTRTALDCLAPEQVEIDRGVVVDEHMQTSVPDLFAAGDCCQGRDLSIEGTRLIGLWANAVCQGETAGKNMAGLDAAYPGNLLHNITHFMDMDFVSFGDKSLPGERRVFVDKGRQYAEATISDGRVRCINLLKLFKNSGAVKNYMLRALYRHDTPADAQMKAVLLKSGLPRELTELLMGGEGT